MEAELNSFDAATRRQALAKLLPLYSSFNMHCHSFFSYNGYGYSPSYLVMLAKKLNWRAVGMVDFDVLDGVDEFLTAAKTWGVRAVAGMETRVFVPELADREINSPGEPGIAYHLGYGFTSSQVPAAAAAFAAELRRKSRERTREMVEKVNAFLGEAAIDFNATAQRFTPAGNVTERHLCAAYRERAAAVFAGAELAAYWTEKLGRFEEDPVKLEALIRSKTMKKGGVGYAEPTPESFPTLTEMNKFVQTCGAVPTVAWLNGCSAGEADPAALLELHVKHGAGAITIIPDRNWNVKDPDKQRQLVGNMAAFLAEAARRKLPVLAGTEMNAPGQLLADDFTVLALISHLEQFLAGADALV